MDHTVFAATTIHSTDWHFFTNAQRPLLASLLSTIHQGTLSDYLAFRDDSRAERGVPAGPAPRRPSRPKPGTSHSAASPSGAPRYVICGTCGGTEKIKRSPLRASPIICQCAPSVDTLLALRHIFSVTALALPMRPLTPPHPHCRPGPVTSGDLPSLSRPFGHSHPTRTPTPDNASDELQRRSLASAAWAATDVRTDTADGGPDENISMGGPWRH